MHSLPSPVLVGRRLIPFSAPHSGATFCCFEPKYCDRSFLVTSGLPTIDEPRKNRLYRVTSQRDLFPCNPVPEGRMILSSLASHSDL